MQGGHLINTHLMMECAEHINQDQRSFACGGGESSVSGPCVRALAGVLWPRCLPGREWKSRADRDAMAGIQHSSSSKFSNSEGR
jgi:hypothetical protein